MFSSEYIIKVFAGTELLQALSLVNFLIFSILFLAMKDVFGVQILIPNGFNKIFTKIILISLFVYVLQIMIVWFISGFSSLNIIAITLITEFLWLYTCFTIAKN